jgi:hypothetical protein
MWVAGVRVGLDHRGNFGLWHAVGEEEVLLVSMGDGEGLVVEVTFTVEVEEGEERYDIGVVEDAIVR